MSLGPLDKLSRFFESSGLSRYQLREVIASGRMSTIHRAYDSKTYKSVAVKVLNEAGLKMRKVLRAKQPELDQIIVSIEHPNVVRTFEFIQRGQKHYQVMEYVQGTNIGRMKGRSFAELFSLLVEAARGLQYLHDRYNLIHRDINPNNIVVNSENIPKIIDMDFAFVAVNDSKGILRRSGTLGYMAPEQVKGRQLTKSMDIYSWGATAYEILTGANPYRDHTGSSEEMRQENTRRNHLRLIPQPPSKVNPEINGKVDAVIMRCLEIETSARYPSIGDLVAELERVCGSFLPSSRKSSARRSRA